MKKLIALNLVALAIVIGLAGVVWFTTHHAETTLTALRTYTDVRMETAEIRTDMIQMSDAMRGYLLDPRQQKEYDKKKQADADLAAAVARLLAKADNPQYRELASRVAKLDEEKLDPIENRVLEMAPANAKGATAIYFNEYLPVRTEQMALVDRLRELSGTAFDAEMKTAAATMARTSTMVTSIGGIVIVAIALAFVWSVRTTRVITRRIAAETSTLAETAQAVLQASREMAAGSQTLSQGATEQAASLEETSASMEEMASMTRRNAEHSQSAAGLMTQVDRRVQESHAALDGMVEAMRRIDTSGREVAKIIKTIDEIAFQTNILALNAAVEAARAGESGMGFAVVADEVRSLAQRSAQAARDTASLIEQSLGNTAEGGRKVEQVGASIAAITASVTEVKSLVDQVSVASQEQSRGIEQVSQAIAQMEKVTQTTAATAEESAAAGEELHAQAESSLGIVERLETLVGVTRGVSPRQTPAAPSAGGAGEAEFDQAA